MTPEEISYSNLSAYLPLANGGFFRGGNSLKERFKDAEFMSSGRAALADIAEFLRQSSGLAKPVLHIPEFFCPALTEFLEARFSVKKYTDLPNAKTPDFSTLRASPHDAVLAVNFFGQYNKFAWKSWKADNPQCVLIEDHSHAPLCDSLSSGVADVSMASFRKVLPLCGAVLKYKSRRPRAIFAKGRDQLNCYEATMLAAREIKSRLGADANGWKAVFNTFEKAERALEYNFEHTRISFHALNTLMHFDVKLAAKMRAENFAAFAEELSGKTRDRVEIINLKTLSNPYNNFDVFSPVLLFESHALRNKVRGALKAAGAEPPVFWAKIKSDDSASKDISERIMTLPLSYESTPDFSRRAAKFVLKQMD